MPARHEAGKHGKEAVIPTYDFVLTFALPDANAAPSDFTDALFEAGCDDATVGVGKRGSIALDFSREAPSAERAVRSAIEDVQRAIPGAELVEAKPDLANLADLAGMVGCSRQNMRKYAAGEIRTAKASFPHPAFTGSPSLWHSCEVIAWLAKHTELNPAKELGEVSFVAYTLNAERQYRRRKRVRELAAAKAVGPENPQAAEAPARSRRTRRSRTATARCERGRATRL